MQGLHKTLPQFSNPDQDFAVLSRTQNLLFQWDSRGLLEKCIVLVLALALVLPSQESSSIKWQGLFPRVCYWSTDSFNANPVLRSDSPHEVKGCRILPERA